MEKTRRPRVVKRVPFLKRILNAPGDYSMRAQSRFQAMDWDKLQQGFRCEAISTVYTYSHCEQEVLSLTDGFYGTQRAPRLRPELLTGVC